MTNRNDEREALAAAYFPRVKKMVRAFVRRNSNARWAYHELLSGASDRLVKVIDRHLEGKVTNFDSYLRLNIRGAMIDVIRRVNSNPLRYDPDLDHSTGKPIATSEIPFSPEFLEESREALEEACVDDVDRALISMIRVRRTTKRQSKRLTEDELLEVELRPIGRELQLSPLEIQERVGEILKRYKAQLNG